MAPVGMFLKWKIARLGVLNFATQFHCKNFSMGATRVFLKAKQIQHKLTEKWWLIPTIAIHWPEGSSKSGPQDERPQAVFLANICPSLERKPDNARLDANTVTNISWVGGNLRQYHSEKTTSCFVRFMLVQLMCAQGFTISARHLTKPKHVELKNHLPS